MSFFTLSEIKVRYSYDYERRGEGKRSKSQQLRNSFRHATLSGARSTRHATAAADDANMFVLGLTVLRIIFRPFGLGA